MKLIAINNKTKLIVFILIILISFYRSPYIFLNGRFIAEEANHHYLFALNNNFISNIFYYIELAGYYNILPNIFTWIATLVSIENAPYVTVYSSFIVILILPYLSLFRESILFKTCSQKVIGSLILFLSPPFVVELWLNTLNSQIYLCLISILILFMINLSDFQKKFNNFLIFISGFSGIYTCALIPFFIHKYIKDRNNYNFTNVIILASSNLVQMGIIIYSKINNKLHSSVLSNDYNMEMLSNFIYNIIAKPFLGRDLTHIIWNNFSFFGKNYNLYILFFLSSILMLLLFNLKKILTILRKDVVLTYLVLIFIIISSIILIGSLNNQVGGRYAAISGVIVILIVFYLSAKVKNILISKFLFVLIILSLLTGAYEFRPKYKVNLKNPDHNYLKQLDCLNCPEWKSEIKFWRNNENYRIGLWPYHKKTLILKIIKDE
tara:strand:+ start:670 stop:1977 length:1308 start_codon:yes stop_codon:yes gene_type:complete